MDDGVDDVPRRVLVAIDHLGDFRPALSFACHEARAAGLRIELVHVLDESRPGPETRTACPWQECVDAAAAVVAELAGEEVEVGRSLRRGSVEDVLVDLSRGSELCVVQHRRLTRLHRIQAGSTAVAVAGRVHSRIVCVPEDWRPEKGFQGPVTVGVDAVDTEAQLLLEQAFRYASREGSAVRVLHGWTMASPYDDALVDARIEQDWAAAYRERLRAVLDPQRRAYPEVPVDVVLRHLAPPKALAEASTDSRLVMVGRGRMVHPLVRGLGSVPRAALQDSRCPVEVVAPHLS